MKARHLLAMVGLGFILGVALQSWADEGSSDEASPTVVQLEFRGYRIFVSAGDQGSLYTVRDRDGKIVADRVTAGDLQVKLPEVHQFVKGAFAGDRKTYIDASVHTPLN